MTVVNLEDFNKAIMDVFEGEIEKVAKATELLIDKYEPKIVDAIKQRSPQGKNKGGKRYKSGWTSTATENMGVKSVVVHNKSKPSLTHILEEGTGIRKTKRGANRGRIEKHQHIRPAVDPLLRDFENELKKI